MNSRQFEERISQAFGFLFLVLPLLVLPMVFWQFTLPKVVLVQLFAYAGLLFWAVSLARAGTLRWGLPHYVVAVFLAWVVVSGFTGLSPAVSILGKYGRYQGILTYSAYAGVFFLASQVSWAKGRPEKLFLLSSISLAAVSAYAIVQYLGVDPIHWGAQSFEQSRVFATFGNPNFLGSYLTLILPFALALYLRRTGSSRLIFGAILVGGIAAVVVTFSRGAWLSAGVALLITAYLERKRLLDRHDLRAISAVGAIAVAVLLVIAFSGGDYLFERFLSAFDPGSGSFAQRLEIWKAAIGATAARPLFGFGPDSFRFVFPTYMTREYILISGRGVLQNDAHNFLLGLTSSSGVPAALLYLALPFAALWQRKTFPAGPHGEDDSLFLSALTASVIAYPVNTFLTVNPVGSAALFWAMLGILAAASPAKRISGKSARIMIARAAVAILALAVLAISLFTTAADWRYKSGLNKLSNGLPEQAVADIKEAQALNPYYDEYAFSLGKIWLDRALAGRVRSDFDQAVFWFETAVRAAPYEPNNHIFLSQSLFFAGQTYPEYLAPALKAAGEGRKLQPRSPSLLYISAAAEHEGGDHKKARGYIKFALRLDPDYPEAYELLGLINEKLGHEAQAIKAYEKAISLDSTMEAARARLANLKK